MTRALLIFGGFLLLLLSACASPSSERLLGIDEIPAAIQAAAVDAAPGLHIFEAELEEGGAVYCVHGHVDGLFTEVEVSSDGRVLEIERGDEDEDEDD